MSMTYIRKTYGVPAKRGMRVKVHLWGVFCNATITSADGPYLVVKPDGWPNARPKFHPHDIDFVTHQLKPMISD